MSEHNLWVWLRDVALPTGHYSRIESPDTAPGFPDVDYQIGDHCTGKIELKYCGRRNASVPFPDEARGLHLSQLKWIRDNLTYWGTVWIIAEAVPDIFVLHGSEAVEFNGSTRENLYKISVAVLDRDDPEEAATLLHNILRGHNNV